MILKIEKNVDGRFITTKYSNVTKVKSMTYGIRVFFVTGLKSVIHIDNEDGDRWEIENDKY